MYLFLAHFVSMFDNVFWPMQTHIRGKHIGHIKRDLMQMGLQILMLHNCHIHMWRFISEPESQNIIVLFLSGIYEQFKRICGIHQFSRLLGY